MEKREKTSKRESGYRSLQESGHLSPESASSSSSRSKKSSVFSKKSKTKEDKRGSEKNKTPLVDRNSPPQISRRIFGVPLMVAVQSNPSHDGIPIPVVVRNCIDYITENGLDVEGVYRLSATKSKLEELQQMADREGRVLINDVHQATGILKRFLREIIGHLLTDNLVDDFERLAAECPCQLSQCCTCLVADRIKATLRQLPPCNFYLTAYFFRHMNQIIAHSVSNKMGIAALGLVLQATLKLSQSLLRIFLLNACSIYVGTRDKDTPAVFLFDDVELKRYVPPRLPSELSENLPSTIEQLEEELVKQESFLRQLHEQVSDMRRLNIDISKKEIELWDVQMVITLLKRKSKAMQPMIRAPCEPIICPQSIIIQQSPPEDENHVVIEQESIPLLILEEKHLMDTQKTLKEEINGQKMAILRLHEQLLTQQPLVQDIRMIIQERNEQMEGRCREETRRRDTQQQPLVQDIRMMMQERNEQMEGRCREETRRRDTLIAAIIDERSRCSRLRAELELLNAQRQPMMPFVARF